MLIVAAAFLLPTTLQAAALNKIAKARLYVAARGTYDRYLNGQRIASVYFNPGLTQGTRLCAMRMVASTEILAQNP